MRLCLVIAGLTAGLCGCHTPKYDLAAKYPEEFVTPPNEPRFDHPPESAYRKPPPKKDIAPGPGMGGPPGMGGGPQGYGRGFQ
jgi:hypothetical protein